MKIVLQIFILFLFFSSKAQNDTLNQFDDRQIKQGYWILKFENTDQTLEEGRYVDGQRQGLWKQYLDNGVLSSEITYVEDEPYGRIKIYYPNGKVAEEGTWRNEVWVGEYISYYKNGHINYKWNFTEDGKRTGIQEYYHENGNKMISGNWENGAEAGVIKRFNEQGELIEEQTFNNGKINPELTVKHQVKQDVITVEPEVKVLTEVKDTVKPEKRKLFDTTGDTKLYDKDRRLWKEGYFENGKLIKGKRYFYNKENILVKTQIYKEGKVFKTIVSEKK